MQACSGEVGYVMGPTVPGNDSPKPTTPPLNDGNNLAESGYLTTVGSKTSRFTKHKGKITFIVVICLFSLLLVFGITMTVLYALQKHHKPVRICESKECLRSAANLALSMDLTADPCEDFYQYTCGNWAEAHPRPYTYLSYDWFRAKQLNVNTLVRDFLTRNSTDSPRAVNAAKDMYAACMDTDTLDKQGLKPIISVLTALGLPPFPTFINVTKVDYSSYTFDWLETVIKIKTQIGKDVIIGFNLDVDPRNSSTYALYMGKPDSTNTLPSLQYKQKDHSQGSKGIQMPRRKRNENIIQDNNFAEMVDVKDNDKYDIVYAQLMKIFVSGSEENKVKKITETELDENIKRTKDTYILIKKGILELENDNSADSEDENYYNLPRFTVDELQNLTDRFHNNATATPIWKRYLEGLFNVSNVSPDFENDKIFVETPGLMYLAQVAAYMAQTPPVIIELYIWIEVVEKMAFYTTSELQTLFDKDAYYSGSRSWQCVNAVNDMLDMAVSYGIADPHFFNVSKPKIEIMLNELKNSLAHLVGKAKWMDDDTKLETYQKIVQMKSLIGFPDWLLEEGNLDEYYSGIEVQPGKYLENFINIRQASMIKNLNKFHAVQNMTWTSKLTEVNANYIIKQNAINVPLVSLQYPFFDLGIESLNYGALGTILGHEITHGFDNEGRYFDKNANAVPWWTNETVESFENKTKCLVDQYSRYYLPGLHEHVDGDQTLAENIADNGGVREALAALRNHLSKTGPEKKLPGFEKFTSDQMFFLSFGNLWCSVSTTKSLQSNLEDVHAPGQFRVTGSLQNNEAFAKSWNCKPGSFMNPEKKCIIY